MSKAKTLEESIKTSGGVITSKLVDENNIHREYLSKLTRQGRLITFTGKFCVKKS